MTDMTYKEVKNLEKVKVQTALIIDDELDICYLLGGILKHKKFSTSYVNTLREAKSALRTNPPELLFLDNHLPDGIGLDFISYIKHHHPVVKIIMITAHDSAAERKRAYAEGVNSFLSKPFTKELICSAIDSVTTAKNNFK